jgi:hypothetical protein
MGPSTTPSTSPGQAGGRRERAPAGAARRLLRMPGLRPRREEDLHNWRGDFPDATPIAELRLRNVGTCVGIATRIRLDPRRSLEVTVEDGTGRLKAVWLGRSRLPGLRLGAGLRLTGTVALDDDIRVLRNPEYELVADPYA